HRADQLARTVRLRLAEGARLDARLLADQLARGHLELVVREQRHRVAGRGVVEAEEVVVAGLEHADLEPVGREHARRRAAARAEADHDRVEAVEARLAEHVRDAGGKRHRGPRQAQKKRTPPWTRVITSTNLSTSGSRPSFGRAGSSVWFGWSG